jgi:hypothetical protein
MAEYIVMTEGNSFYYLEGKGKYVNISSLGKHSSLDISKRPIVCAFANQNEIKGGGIEKPISFTEEDIKTLVGKQIKFSDPYGGNTSRVSEIFLKIS